EGGLARIRSNRVEKLWATPGRKTRNSVALVWACTNDVVWTTTGLPDLFRFEKDHFSIASNANNSTTNIISCLWRAPSGAFYCCSSDGVFVFNDNKPIPWRSYAATYSITNARAMLQEPDGTLWFAPEDKGLAKVQRSE